MINTIREQEDILFDEWKQKYPNSIVPDGVVNEDEYQNIVFVLKEVNGGKSWDLRGFLADGGRQSTWNNIARWTEGLSNIDKDIHWSLLESVSDEKRKTLLNKICAMNVKKVPGKAVANNAEVQSVAECNKKLLQKQMAMYNPKIIICCGVDGNLFDNIFPNSKKNWKMTSRGIWYLDNKETILIGFNHPAARTRDCFLYYSLIDAAKEILNIKSQC